MRIEVTTEESFLNHLNKSIHLSELSNKPFSVIRLRVELKLSKEKTLKIKEVIENEKRAQDFMRMNKNGSIDLILRDTDSKMTKVVYHRLSKQVERVFDNLELSCSTATFPIDGKTPDMLLKKL